MSVRLGRDWEEYMRRSRWLRLKHPKLDTYRALELATGKPQRRPPLYESRHYIRRQMERY